MDGMTTKAKMLSQDDIDSILTQDGDTHEGEEENRPGLQNRPPPASTISDEAFQGILEELQNRASLDREPGVTVIWNAQGTFPMASGIKMNINGVDYVSLGVLFDQHLVLECHDTPALGDPQ